MEAIIDKIIDVLPLPVLVAVGLIGITAWVLKEAKGEDRVGVILRLRSFQMFCALVALPLAVFYGHYWYSQVFPPAQFAPTDRGIALYALERDLDGLVQLRLFESLQLASNNLKAPSVVKVKRSKDSPRDRDEAIGLCKQIRASVCVWGSFFQPTNVFLHAVIADNTSIAANAQMTDYAQSHEFYENVIRMAAATHTGTHDQPAHSVVEKSQQEILKRLAAVEQSVSELKRNDQVDELFEAERSRRRVGLFIGNSQYEEFPALRFAANDAQAMAETFQNLGGVSTSLTNASRDEMLRAFDNLEKETLPDDQVWVYLTGHAVVGEDGKDVFFLPIAAKAKSIREDGISYAEIKGRITRLRSQQIIMIIDTCYAGSLLAGLSPPDALTDVSSDRPGKGTIIMVATGASALSFESQDAEHGLFTGAILKGLMGDAAAEYGAITAVSLFNYARDTLSKYDLNGVVQEPLLYSDADGPIILTMKEGS